MAILVTCSVCQTKLHVRDEFLNREIQCPSCKATLTATGEHAPNHEVFISYSNKDKSIADAVCSALETQHIRCWIAPRDIAPGTTWGGSIIQAIEDARIMVLIYSGSANLSSQVIREVERAVAKGLVGGAVPD
jgi:phage FluMu protein Com